MGGAGVRTGRVGWGVVAVGVMVVAVGVVAVGVMVVAVGVVVDWWRRVCPSVRPRARATRAWWWWWWWWCGPPLCAESGLGVQQRVALEQRLLPLDHVLLGLLRFPSERGPSPTVLLIASAAEPVQLHLIDLPFLFEPNGSGHTALHCTALRCAVLRSTVLCCTAGRRCCSSHMSHTRGS
jgi:hypothetical protein